MSVFTIKEDVPWVIFRLDNLKFAIDSNYVAGMEITGKVSEIPKTDASIRGIFQFRNQSIALIDLRTRLGLRSMQAETDDFCEMLDARKNDHVNWLTELDSSVHEKRDFRLTTDPHSCAFGKWYDSYVAPTHSLKSLLRKFDEPHKRIHSIAQKVTSAAKSGALKEAENIIENCRERELLEMIKLFSAVKDEYKNNQRETTIVYETKQGFRAFAVDQVLTVERVAMFDGTEEQYKYLNLSQTNLIHSIAKQAKTDDVVYLINHENLE